MKLRVYDHEGANGYALFFCPACDSPHAVRVNTHGSGWGWNGSVDAPTLTPSVFSNQHRDCPDLPACHSFVTEGRIQFLADCTHAMAGQTVDLPDWPGDDQ